jgi:hypothetical protein
MRFYLDIECDNDAFGGSPALATVELGRILEDIARKLDREGQLKGHAWDCNGNRCGVWQLDDRPDAAIRASAIQRLNEADFDAGRLQDMMRVTRQAVADYQREKGRRDAR